MWWYLFHHVRFYIHHPHGPLSLCGSIKLRASLSGNHLFSLGRSSTHAGQLIKIRKWLGAQPITLLVQTFYGTSPACGLRIIFLRTDMIYSNLSRVASAQLKNMRCWVNIELISRWSMMIHINTCFLSLWGPTNVKTTRQGRRSNSDNGLSWVVSCEPWLWDLRTGSDRLTSQNQGGPMFRFTLW